MIWGHLSFLMSPSSSELSQLPTSSSAAESPSCTPCFLHATSVLPSPSPTAAIHPNSDPAHVSAQAAVHKTLVRPSLLERRSAACKSLHTEGLQPVGSHQPPCQHPTLPNPNRVQQATKAPQPRAHLPGSWAPLAEHHCEPSFCWGFLHGLTPNHQFPFA